MNPESFCEPKAPGFPKAVYTKGLTPLLDPSNFIPKVLEYTLNNNNNTS